MTHLLIIIFICFLTACSSLKTLKKNHSAEELFQHAVELKEKSYYKKALVYFKQLKSRFLYSRLAKEADLAIADIYFAQEEWDRAVKAYGSFSELYPKHPQNDRVLFHLALSYFHKLPTTEDRDLSLSKKTLFYFNKHIEFFPHSSYKIQVKEYKQKILNLLARKEWMIARFHLNQGKPVSALPYVLKLMRQYSFLLPSDQKNEQQSGKEKDSAIKASENLPSVKNLKNLAQELKTLKKQSLDN